MAEKSPTISVVIGAYNAQRFLRETLDSLLAQTFTDFELIVVDDGSTDGTFAILQEYAARDTRMRPLQIAHSGIVDAANAGIAASRADLIARADADDIYHPDRLQRQFDFLASHPDIVAVSSQMQVIEPFGMPIKVTECKFDHEAIEADLLSGNGAALPQPAVMFRKAAVQLAGGYRNDYPHSEDFDLFLRLAEVGRLANLPDLLVQYRQHNNSTNWNHWQDQMRNKPKILAEAMQRRGKKVPDFPVFGNYWKSTPAERFRHWAWIALKQRNVTAARRHAWAAVSHAPFSKESWRALYCAARGR